MSRKLNASGLAILFAASFLSLQGTALAANSDDGTVPVPTCSKNKVWDAKQKKCVPVQKSSNLSDDNIYDGARDLAYHGRYDEAIVLLKLANNPQDPRILNYLGYSTRKLGRVEEGLTYYQAALKADPDYTLVMEYMGEAFLQLGQVDKAREQLTAIERRCGKGCREYSMLDQQIRNHLGQ